MAASRQPVSACEVRVYPINAAVSINENLIKINLRNNYEYWQKKILPGYSITDLGAGKLIGDLALDYINSHCIVKLDGNTLKGRLAYAAYSRDPWVSTSEAEVRFTLHYDISGIKAKNLSIRFDFFDEGHEGHKHGDEHLVKHEFYTNLKVVTGKKNNIKLTHEQNTANLILEDYVETASQRSLGWFLVGLRILYFAPILLVFAAVAMLGFSDKINAAVLLGFAVAGIAAGCYCPYCASLSFTEALALIWLVIFCAYRYAFTGRGFNKNAEYLIAAVSGVILGLYAFKKFAVSNTESIFSFFDFLFFISGAVISLIVLYAAEYILLALYRKKLKSKYESVFESKYAQSARFAALMAAVIAFLVFIKRIKNIYFG